MYRVRWDRVRAIAEADRRSMADEAINALAVPDAGSTALVQVLGHKADLMVICFRRGFEPLAGAQVAFSRTAFHDLLEPTSSYVSVVELGMYEMTAKIHAQIGASHKPGTDEFDRAFDTEMETQRQRVMNRLFLDMPAARYVCFYPMNKRRGEALNWYTEGFDRRAAMMREHGMIGRHYAGKVTQVISGSIGFDDWEWGRRPVRPRSARLQEADLRDALRRSEREICRVRALLHGPPVRARPTRRISGGRGARVVSAARGGSATGFVIQ
jgi:chlorite dismutase